MDASVAVKLELAAEAARKFGKIQIKVTGDSMLPSVCPGDVLTVVRQPLARFQPGDIVLAARRTSGHPPALQFIAHRVIRRHGHQLITRGDSLRHPDPPVEEEEILGRVTGITRRGRPVDPSLTPARRLTSWVLRRHHLGSRILLRLHRLRDARATPA